MALLPTVVFALAGAAALFAVGPVFALAVLAAGAFVAAASRRRAIAYATVPVRSRRGRRRP